MGATALVVARLGMLVQVGLPLAAAIREVGLEIRDLNALRPASVEVFWLSVLKRCGLCERRSALSFCDILLARPARGRREGLRPGAVVVVLAPGTLGTHLLATLGNLDLRGENFFLTHKECL